LYYSFGRDRDFNQKILHNYQNLMSTYHKRGTGPTAIADASLLVAPMRLRKSADEMELLRKAIAISVDAHNLAFQSAAPGMYEYEIQAQIENHFRRNGALGPAYPSIVAAGENSCILHYVENNQQLRAGDLLLIDAGCSYEYYNADITRTFPVSGKFTPAQKTIYELVLEAQLAAIAQVKPGKQYNAMHDAAVKVITEGLVELGLLTGSLEDLIKDEKYKPFFMHRTGHWLGIDVHDVGVYKYGENWQGLDVDMVVTIEPGIYIAPDATPAEGQPEIPDMWKGIGIRIEDDVRVANNSEGHEVLTRGVPKSLAAMERV
jgi:Xaa-Pro aminopeptidase